MIQRGIVLSISGDKVQVEVTYDNRTPQDGLKPCCTVSRSTIEVTNKDNLALQPGDAVSLVTSTWSLAASVIMGFGIPILFFVVAYTYASDSFGISSPLGKFGTGLVGLLIGLLWPLLYFRFFPHKKNEPEIRRLP